jgi:hypothetical protein
VNAAQALLARGGVGGDYSGDGAAAAAAAAGVIGVGGGMAMATATAVPVAKARGVSAVGLPMASRQSVNPAPDGRKNSRVSMLGTGELTASNAASSSGGWARSAVSAL